MGILAGGNWIIDNVKFVDVYPKEDKLANILKESNSNGGAPYSVLKAISNGFFVEIRYLPVAAVDFLKVQRHK